MYFFVHHDTATKIILTQVPYNFIFLFNTFTYVIIHFFYSTTFTFTPRVFSLLFKHFTLKTYGTLINYNICLKDLDSVSQTLWPFTSKKNVSTVYELIILPTNNFSIFHLNVSDI